MVTAGWDGWRAGTLGPHWHNLGSGTEKMGGCEKEPDSGHSGFRTLITEGVEGH